MVNFDDILFEINEFGPYQKLRFGLICIAAMLPGIVTYVHSFTAAKPSYICNQGGFDMNMTNVTYDKCHYIVDGEKYPCNSWSFDKTYYQSTLTEEWSMVCDRSFYSSYVQMIYFSGYVFGSVLLGFLADIFGRRPIMLSSFILFIFAGLGSALGPQESFGFEISFIIYAFSRFVIACANRGINDTGYILALETVGVKYRAHAAMIFPLFFSVGELFLVTFAFFIREWRYLALAMVVPLFPFLSYFFIIAESPRWLISKGRTDEAFKNISKIAKVNKREIDENTWATFIKDNKEEKKTETSENMLDLLKSPKLVILLIVMFVNWIVCNLGFYGVGLKSNDLGVNPYLSFAISATFGLVAYIVGLALINKFGRKYPYILSVLVNGVACTSIYFFDGNVVVTVSLAMLGRFSITMAYAIIHLYSSEVFPTSIRATCQGACSMMARFGSIIAPLIIGLDDIYKGLPFLVFGSSALLCAFTALVLPETHNRKLPKNLKEAENVNVMNCLPTVYQGKDNLVQLE